MAWNELLNAENLRGMREIEVNDGLPFELSMTLSAALLEQLMKQDCTKGYGFWTEKNYFVVDANPSCAVFNKPYTLYSADGFAFFSEGVKAYLSVKKNCEARLPVSLGTDAPEVLKILCDRPLNNLPRLFTASTVNTYGD